MIIPDLLFTDHFTRISSLELNLSAAQTLIQPKLKDCFATLLVFLLRTLISLQHALDLLIHCTTSSAVWARPAAAAGPHRWGSAPMLQISWPALHSTHSRAPGYPLCPATSQMGLEACTTCLTVWPDRVKDHAQQAASLSSGLCLEIPQAFREEVSLVSPIKTDLACARFWSCLPP